MQLMGFATGPKAGLQFKTEDVGSGGHQYGLPVPPPIEIPFRTASRKSPGITNRSKHVEAMRDSIQPNVVFDSGSEGTDNLVVAICQ
jgi:hypothetical protein